MTTNHTSSTPNAQTNELLNSPLRHLVHVALFLEGGEADLSDIRSFIRNRCDSGTLPANWKVQVRDILKHDPEIEKSDEGTWLLRSSGASAT